jgi:hypothetical protein
MNRTAATPSEAPAVTGSFVTIGKRLMIIGTIAPTRNAPSRHRR